MCSYIYVSHKKTLIQFLILEANSINNKKQIYWPQVQCFSFLKTGHRYSVFLFSITESELFGIVNWKYRFIDCILRVKFSQRPLDELLTALKH